MPAEQLCDMDVLTGLLPEDDWLADFGKAEQGAEELLLGSELRSCTSVPFLQVCTTCLTRGCTPALGCACCC